MEARPGTTALALSWQALANLSLGRLTSTMSEISHPRYRFSPVIIQQTMWLYLRFIFSFRDVEDLMAESGMIAAYEAVCRWVNQFGPKIAAGLCKRRPKPHPSGHLDEAYLKIDGRPILPWRAADPDGEASGVLVQTRGWYALCIMNSAARLSMRHAKAMT
jgi:transposase-like protein